MGMANLVSGLMKITDFLYAGTSSCKLKDD